MQLLMRWRVATATPRPNLEQNHVAMAKVCTWPVFQLRRTWHARGSVTGDGARGRRR
jgi:hypothetical protein